VSHAPSATEGEAHLRAVPFALRLIAHRKTRSVTAAAGIGFAILVIFMQLGFYGAVLNTALAVTSRFNADLYLASPRFVHLNAAGTIPRGRLFQVLALPEVMSATPLYFQNAVWRDPLTGERCRLFALGFPLDEAERSLPLRLPEIAQHLDALRTTNTVLLDRLTQSECGPTDLAGNVEIHNQAAQVVGRFEIGIGFLADGTLIMSDDSFSRMLGWRRLDNVSLGLVKLRPGSDPAAVAARLQQTLPRDVVVLDREALDAYQIRHWVQNTAIGNIFRMGSIAGFFVGVVVLFQIMSADIRNHLPLYATLRAMGYTKLQLCRYVFEQSWIFAVLGYLPALGVSLALYPLVHNLTYLPIYMTMSLAAGVALLSLLMCSIAALLCMNKLVRVDPAELF
jgi:putative ABC transport system permease protein